MQKKLEGKKHPLLFLIPAAIGLFFVAFGLYILHEDKQKAARCSETVPGTVLEMLESVGYSGTLYVPVFAYSYDGTDYWQENSNYTYPPRFSGGEELVIMLNPDDPDEYFVPGDKANTTMARIFIILGLVLAGSFIFFIAQLCLKKKTEDASTELNKWAHMIDMTYSDGSADPTLPRVFLALGILCIVIGSGFLTYDRISIKSMQRTEATVIGTHSTGSRKGRTYYADIAYSLDWQDYQNKITVSSFFSKTRVTVWCRPDKPQICRTQTEFLLFYIILFGVGGHFITGSIIIRKMDR